MLATYASVEHALSHYSDCCQPRSGSVTSLGGGKGSGGGTSFHPALLDDLEERRELGRRMAWLDRDDALVLLRWYVEGARPEAIAAGLARSLRHVYRRRTSAIQALVALGRSDDFEDADVAEFC
jgi:hypothetical protein